MSNVLGIGIDVSNGWFFIDHFKWTIVNLLVSNYEKTLWLNHTLRGMAKGPLGVV